MAKVKITEAVAEKVLLLTCNNDENIRRLEKSLMRLPFIKDEDDLEVANLEKLILKIESKYPVNMSYIMKYNQDTTHVYSTMLRGKSSVWLKTIYSITIREALMKTLFYMYYHVESEKEKDSG